MVQLAKYRKRVEAAAVFLHLLQLTQALNNTSDAVDNSTHSSGLNLTTISQTPAFPNVDATAIQADVDLGLCACDLTFNVCDVNCCCDTECSDTDKLVFSKCTTSLQSRETKSYLCSYKEPQIVGYSIADNTVTNPNVFCIWRDRNDARNYYAIPSLVKSADQFADYVDSSLYSYKLASTTSVADATIYKHGDSLITHYRDQSQVKGVLAMPIAMGVSSQCLDTNPIQFLVDKSSSCFRNLKQRLEYSCHNETSLNAEQYVNRLNNTVVGNKDNGTIGITVSGGTQTPIFNSTTQTCYGVLTKVKFEITYDNDAIVSTSVLLTLDNIPNHITSIEQSYSVKFVRNTLTNAISRSGNPGYLNGKPVLAGRLTNSYINLNGDNQQYFTVINADADGTCLTNATLRTPVLFGENIRSGCLLEVSSLEEADSCAQLLDIMKEALLGPERTLDTDGSVYIASFGNSNRLQPADWVPLIVISQPPSSLCVGLAIRIEILYSYVGSLQNPQAMIIGAKITFDTIDYDFLCLGVYCSSNVDITNKFEVISSVNFVDVTSPPEVIYAEVPVSSSKLPADFFKPYYTETNSALMTSSSLNGLVLFFIQFLHVFTF